MNIHTYVKNNCMSYLDYFQGSFLDSRSSVTVE